MVLIVAGLLAVVYSTHKVCDVVRMTNGGACAATAGNVKALD